MDQKAPADAPDWLLAGLAAGGAFVACFVFFDFGLLPALAVSGGCGVGGLFLFRRRSPIDSIQLQDLESALAEGRRKLDQIRGLQRQFKPGPAAVKVEALAATVAKILTEVKRDPGDLKAARQFLSYYLDATILILTKYVKLAGQDVADQAVRAALDRVDGMLSSIGQAYEKQLARLLSNDVLDLDTELSLLEKTINMEGLGE